MDKILQDKLFKKYPKIFRQKDLTMQETAMCWGIDCGNGWYWLIEHLCEHIQWLCEPNRIKKVKQVEASQVKQKFGGLRFYIDTGTDEIYNVIHFAEFLSYSICELCGSTNNVTLSKSFFVESLCEECMKKQYDKKY